MFKEVKVGDITVPMLANGATPLRYKMVFAKDLLTEFQAGQENTANVVNCVPELAFIMAKAAEAKEGKADLNLINKDMFVEWLEQFEPMDLPMAADEIVNLYTGNLEGHSEPKKKEKKN